MSKRNYRFLFLVLFAGCATTMANEHPTGQVLETGPGTSLSVGSEEWFSRLRFAIKEGDTPIVARMLNNVDFRKPIKESAFVFFNLSESNRFQAKDFFSLVSNFAKSSKQPCNEEILSSLLISNAPIDIEAVEAFLQKGCQKNIEHTFALLSEDHQRKILQLSADNAEADRPINSIASLVPSMFYREIKNQTEEAMNKQMALSIIEGTDTEKVNVGKNHDALLEEMAFFAHQARKKVCGQILQQQKFFVQAVHPSCAYEGETPIESKTIGIPDSFCESLFRIKRHIGRIEERSNWAMYEYVKDLFQSGGSKKSLAGVCFFDEANRFFHSQVEKERQKAKEKNEVAITIYLELKRTSEFYDQWFKERKKALESFIKKPWNYDRDCPSRE